MRLRKYTVLMMKQNINASQHVICVRDSCSVAEVVRVTNVGSLDDYGIFVSHGMSVIPQCLAIENSDFGS